MNILEVKKVQSVLDSQEEPEHITYSTFLANFKNQTFFQIFDYKHSVMEMLVRKIKDEIL